MNLLNFLRIILGYSQTDTVKPSSANAVDANILPGDSETGESAVNAKEKLHSLAERLTGKGGQRMTIEQAKSKWVDWNKSQVGYHEALDGSNKYADGDWDVKLYGFNAQNVPWCDVYSDYSYIACFGYDVATRMTYQYPKGYAACKASAEAYKAHGAFFQTPEVGDQIFFYNGGEINHVGNVISVIGDAIRCVEGNYSDSVSLTMYNIRNTQLIAGYGRPDWSLLAEKEPASNPGDFDDVDDTQFDIVHPENPRTYIHLAYGDGIESNGQKPLPQVKAWQNLLVCWGMYLGQGGADGEFGFDTENATRQWQQKVLEIGGNVEVNGIVDEDDWCEILNVPTDRW